MPDVEPAVFEAVDVQKPKVPWRLLLRPAGFRFEPQAGDGEPVEVAREERADRVTRAHGLLIRRSVSVRVGKKSRLFKLPPAAWEAFNAWYPPYTRADLKAALKRRMSWTFTVGILYLFLALPMPSDPSGALPDRTFDWISAALGGALLLMGVISRLAPHRIFLLADSCWVALIAANTVRGLLAGEGGWFWYLLLYLQVVYVREGLVEFWRFAPSKPAAGGPAPDGGPGGGS